MGSSGRAVACMVPAAGMVRVAGLARSPASARTHPLRGQSCTSAPCRRPSACASETPRRPPWTRRPVVGNAVQGGHNARPGLQDLWGGGAEVPPPPSGSPCTHLWILQRELVLFFVVLHVADIGLRLQLLWRLEESHGWWPMRLPGIGMPGMRCRVRVRCLPTCSDSTKCSKGKLASIGPNQASSSHQFRFGCCPCIAELALHAVNFFRNLEELS